MNGVRLPQSFPSRCHVSADSLCIRDAQVAACGLQLYRFGQAVSLCFWTDSWRPDSFYDRLASNRREGLHTLCLLDIRVKEPTEESLARRASHAACNVSGDCRADTRIITFLQGTQGVRAAAVHDGAAGGGAAAGS